MDGSYVLHQLDLHVRIRCDLPIEEAIEEVLDNTNFSLGENFSW